jgi:hypothetical protein
MPPVPEGLAATGYTCLHRQAAARKPRACCVCACMCVCVPVRVYVRVRVPHLQALLRESRVALAHQVLHERRIGGREQKPCEPVGMVVEVSWRARGVEVTSSVRRTRSLQHSAALVCASLRRLAAIRAAAASPSALWRILVRLTVVLKVAVVGPLLLPLLPVFATPLFLRPQLRKVFLQEPLVGRIGVQDGYELQKRSSGVQVLAGVSSRRPRLGKAALPDNRC